MRARLGWLFSGILAVALVILIVRPDQRSSQATAPSTTIAASSAPTRSSLPDAEPGSVRALVERVKPAVVQITTEQVTLDRLGRPIATGTGIGSGIIYDASGLILTNNHVIEGARSLVVSLPDGRTYPGKLLGGDAQMDLAVVKIEPAAGETLPVATLGESGALGVGDWVVAIGNALGLPGGPTVTVGVVSALGRAVQEPSDTPNQPGPYLYDLIQTDAAINPGNSGGPLFNMAGEVVGINTLGAGGDGDTVAQGIGFAIAISSAQPIAEQLATKGQVSHPFLGISYGLVTPSLAARLGLSVKQGVVISEVAAGTPAARAGLRPRDVLVDIDGQPIVDETALGRALSRSRPGDRIQLGVARGIERVTVEVTLGEQTGQ